jgi:YggT family protein
MSFLISFVNILFWVLNLAIFARVLFSWINPNPYNPLVSLVYQITDPILDPLRRIVPAVGMFDITPIVAWILLDIVRRILIAALTSFFY